MEFAAGRAEFDELLLLPKPLVDEEELEPKLELEPKPLEEVPDPKLLLDPEPKLLVFDPKPPVEFVVVEEGLMPLGLLALTAPVAPMAPCICLAASC